MKDKLTRKRVKIDYKELIKGSGLWRVYKAYDRRTPKRSANRKMYSFCMMFLRKEMEEIKEAEVDLEECIRIAKTPWVDED